MSIYVKQLQATGLYGRLDLEQRFLPEINILHGKNGTGKTLLLHILANALNGQYGRFVYLPFERIVIELSNNTAVILNRTKVDGDTIINVELPGIDQIEKITFSLKDVRNAERDTRLSPSSPRRRAEPLQTADALIPVAYFPAFRTMIEAWKTFSVSERGIIFSEEAIEQGFYRANQRQSVTMLARDLFGSFIPAITYPSPLDISSNLSAEYQNAAVAVGNTTKKLFSQAFLDIFTTLAERRGQAKQQSDAILQQIQSVVIRLEKSALEEGLMPEGDIVAAIRRKVQTFQFHEEERLAADILEVYSNSLEEIAQIQERAFEDIRRYLEAVNGFLLGKRLIIQSESGPKRPRVLIKFDDGSFSELQALSSGERQIVTMIYAASRMSEQKIVLIDEPEISLHVDWQRLLLKKMSEQIQDRQVIVCTHSPIVAADYPLIELQSALRYSHAKYELIDDEMGE